MRPEEALRYAEQARIILDSDRWKDAWSIYREKLLEILEKTPIEDVESVLEAKRMLIVAEKVRGHLEGLMQNGRVYAETIRVEKERNKWWG